MADVSALCSDLDQEDIEYLQQYFQTIASGPQLYHLYSPLIVNQLKNLPGKLTHNYCSLENWDWTNKRNNNNPNKKRDYNITFPVQMSLNNQFDDMKLFEDIINEGIDEEDLQFLKISFNNLQWDSNESQWMNKLSWIDHPPTNTDSGAQYGCARTRELCDAQNLLRARMRGTGHLNKSPKVSSNFSPTPYGKNYKIIKNTVSRNARSDQRRLYTAYESITESSLLNLNELKFRKKKLRLGKSEIHGLGLFAAEDIPVNDIIIEYVGEIIRPVIADIREKKYRSSGIGSYCFKIDEESIIDATRYGNLNRFINHSCVPNSFAKILNINNKKKIVIYSKQAIKVDEEITYDYKMPIEHEKIPCFCKALSCRKTLN